jgi:hypothetical protein
VPHNARPQIPRLGYPRTPAMRRATNRRPCDDLGSIGSANRFVASRQVGWSGALRPLGCCHQRSNLSAGASASRGSSPTRQPSEDDIPWSNVLPLRTNPHTSGVNRTDSSPADLACGVRPRRRRSRGHHACLVGRCGQVCERRICRVTGVEFERVGISPSPDACASSCARGSDRYRWSNRRTPCGLDSDGSDPGSIHAPSQAMPPSARLTIEVTRAHRTVYFDSAHQALLDNESIHSATREPRPAYRQHRFARSRRGMA